MVENLRSAWRSLLGKPMGLVGATMLLVGLAVASLAPWLAPYDPREPVRVTIDTIYARPNPEHLLGTDDAGKDVLSNFIYGARVSLLIGFVASFIAIFIGGTVGIIAGFYGGRIENGLDGMGTPMTGTQTQTVLVVEDDRAVREAVQRALEFEGYPVATARDGARTRSARARALR